MAYSRCLSHPPRNKKYIACVKPVGSNNTALICGIKKCIMPGLIWLEESEVECLKQGERIFSGPNNDFTKMKAKDDNMIFRS